MIVSNGERGDPASAPWDFNNMEIHDLNGTACWDFLGARRLGRLGCARDNKPYIVPIGFAMRNPYLVAFTTFGQKIDYLRANPSACVQFDEINSPQSWTSVIAYGQFEELLDAQGQDEAHRALESAAWWEPGYVKTTIMGHLRPADPVYFRIFVEEISGRRGANI